MMPSNPRPKNWLIVQLRSWHAWIGISTLILLVTFGFTGVYLNHPEWFGIDPVPRETGQVLFTTLPGNLGPLAPLERALEAAHAEWGKAPVSFVQLREEGDRLVYRVRRRGSSDEVTVDARTGRLLAVRRQFQEVRYAEDGTAQESQVSWTRVMFDVHTGRIIGFPGRLIADAGGVALLLLGASGIYLFILPRWRRWRKKASLTYAASSMPRPRM